MRPLINTTRSFFTLTFQQGCTPISSEWSSDTLPSHVVSKLLHISLCFRSSAGDFPIASDLLKKQIFKANRQFFLQILASWSFQCCALGGGTLKRCVFAALYCRPQVQELGAKAKMPPWKQQRWWALVSVVCVSPRAPMHALVLIIRSLFASLCWLSTTDNVSLNKIKAATQRIIKALSCFEVAARAGVWQASGRKDRSSHQECAGCFWEELFCSCDIRLFLE